MRGQREVRCGAPPGELCPEPTRFDACRASTLSGSSSCCDHSRIRSVQSVEAMKGCPRAVRKVVERRLRLGRRGKRRRASERRKEDSLTREARAREKLKGEGEAEDEGEGGEGEARGVIVGAGTAACGRVGAQHTGTPAWEQWVWCGPVGGSGAVVFSRLEPGSPGLLVVGGERRATDPRQGSGKGQARVSRARGGP